MTLFDKITSFENLYTAYKGAARGKHDRVAVLRHDLHAEKILWRLRWQLRNGKYKHGKYRRFKVHDPKERDVASAPFTDRIVHHALCNIIEPIFDRTFIYDSYACRRGKGTHAAVARLQHFLRSAQARGQDFYILRADIRKFFASMDHVVLLELLAKKIYDTKTIKLCEEIIGSYYEPPASLSPQDQMELLGGGVKGLSAMSSRQAGLPIGNLTSQLFANVYLNHLDQFVKHGLGERYYLRYMDDFLIINHSKARLHKVRAELERFAVSELKLALHPKKTNIHKFRARERFVGYDAELYTRRLSKPTVNRFMRRLKRARKTKGPVAAMESWSRFEAYASFAHAQGLMDTLRPEAAGEKEAGASEA